MSRQPFIYAPDNWGSQIISIVGSEAQHLIRTLRVRTGFRFEIFDGIGHQRLVEVVSVSSDELTARVIKSLPDYPVSKNQIVVAVGIVKGARMDFAVEKAAETGASRFIPLLTERSIVSPRERKIDRWREIAKSAAKQSRQARLMEVMKPTALSSALNERNTSSILLSMYETETKLSELIKEMSDSPEITMFIGPEGGFSDSEIELFQSYGIPIANMGLHTLRTETAAAVSVAITRAQLFY